MNVQKLLTATVAVGVVANVIDYVVQGNVLAGYYTQAPFRQDMQLPWLIFGDFVFALVFVWVYDRVYSGFGGGLAGGAAYGFYAGVLMNFPVWIFMHLLISGFGYGLAWIWTIYGIVAAVILGALAGAVYKK